MARPPKLSAAGFNSYFSRGLKATLSSGVGVGGAVGTAWHVVFLFVFPTKAPRFTLEGQTSIPHSRHASSFMGIIVISII